MQKAFALLALVCLGVISISPLNPAAQGMDHVLVARDFLRTMYPDTNGKKYVVTVEGVFAFDGDKAGFDRFELSVGEGAKYVVTYNGCMGTPSPLLLPIPPELQVGPPPTPTLPPDAIRKDCQNLPAHPKQVLEGIFWFGAEGRISYFTLGGPGVRQLDQRTAFAEFVSSHPEMKEVEIVTELKKEGAKYGPGDKAEFIKNLPIQKLEPFLGRLQVLSVDFPPLEAYRENAENWPTWEVKARAKWDHGPDVTYEMDFEQFEGELTSLRILKPRR